MFLLNSFLDFGLVLPLKFYKFIEKLLPEQWLTLS